MPTLPGSPEENDGFAPDFELERKSSTATGFPIAQPNYDLGLESVPPAALLPKELTALNLGLMVQDAAKRPPARAAEIFRISDAVGATPGIVEAEPSYKDQYIKEKFDPEKFSVENPNLTNWIMSDVNNLALVQNDLKTFSALERLAPVAVGSEEIDRMHELGRFIQMERQGDASQEVRDRIAELKLQMQIRGQIDKDEPISHAIGRTIGRSWTQQAEIAKEMGAGAMIGGTIGTALGSLTPVGPIAGAVGGAKIGGGVYVFKYSYDLESAFAYDEYRDSGMTHDQAFVASSVTGFLNAGIETASEYFLLRLMGGSAAAMAGKDSAKKIASEAVKKALRTPSGMTAAANFAWTLNKAGLVEGGEEISQSMVKTAIQNLSGVLTGEGSPEIAWDDFTASLVKEGLGAYAQAIVGPSVVGGMVSVGLDARAAKKAQETHDIIIEIGNAVAQSESFKHSPAKTLEAIGAAVDGGPMQNVFVYAQDWKGAWESQKLDPAMVAAEVMGDGGKAYQQALAQNDDIKIPLKDFATKIGTTAHLKTVAPVVRFRESDMSKAQFDRESEQREKELSSNKDAVNGAILEEDKQFEDSYKRHYDSLIAAGRTPLDAETQSKVYALRESGVRTQLRGQSADQLRATPGEGRAFRGPEEIEQEAARKVMPERKQIRELSDLIRQASAPLKAPSPGETSGTGAKPPSVRVPYLDSVARISAKVKGPKNKADLIEAGRKRNSDPNLTDQQIVDLEVAESKAQIAARLADLPKYLATMTPSQASFISLSMLRAISRIGVAERLGEVDQDIIKHLDALADLATGQSYQQGPVSAHVQESIRMSSGSRGGVTWVASRDGTLFITGDLKRAEEEILLHGIRHKGLKTSGGIKFGSSVSHRVVAALSGDMEKTRGSRAGMVFDHETYEGGEREGKIKGAPEKYDSRAKLPSMRKELKKIALMGVSGRFWYENAGKFMLKMVGGDVEQATKLAMIMSIYSQGTGVGPNITNALKAWYRYLSGLPIHDPAGQGTLAGRFKSQDKEAHNILYNNKKFEGEKRTNFFINLMRSIDPANYEKAQGVTDDLWMMRLFGFEKDGPTELSYKFVEVETNLLAKELGWEPQQVQAALWVAIRSLGNQAKVKEKTDAQSLRAKDFAWKEGQRKFKNAEAETRHRMRWIENSLSSPMDPLEIAEIKSEYEDFIDNYRTQVSMESTPGGSAQILLGLEKADSNIRQEFHEAVFREFRDSDGNNIIAKIMGLPWLGEYFGLGFWEGMTSPGTQFEIATPPRHKPAKNAPKKGEADERITVSDETRGAVDSFAAILGHLLRQDAMGWHRPFAAPSQKDANMMDVFLGKQPLDSELKGVYTIIESEIRGIGADPTSIVLIPSSDGFHVLNASDGKLDNKKFHEILKGAISKAVGGEMEITLWAADSGLQFNNYKENPNGENYEGVARKAGFGTAYAKAIGLLSPRISAIRRDFSARYGFANPDGPAAAANFPPGSQAAQALQAQKEIAPASPQGPPEAGWSKRRVEILLDKYGYSHEEDKSKAYAVKISPSDFLALTASESLEESIVKETEPLDLERMKQETQEIFLLAKEVDGGLLITGHEGRHRAAALRAFGVETIPITIEIRNERVTEILSKASLIPQTNTFRTKPVAVENLLPISYANKEKLLNFSPESRVYFQGKVPVLPADEFFDRDVLEKIAESNKGLWDDTVEGMALKAMAFLSQEVPRASWDETRATNAVAMAYGTTDLEAIKHTPIMKAVFDQVMEWVKKPASIPSSYKQSAEDGPSRGQSSFSQWGVIVEFFRQADPSTGFHEMAHVFLEEMRRDHAFVMAITEASRTDVQKQFLFDVEETFRWLKIKSWAELKREHHEQFARGFEAQLMTGEAPSSRLREVFIRVKAWLSAIYRQVKNLGVDVSPQMADVFNRMIATEDEIAAAQAEQGHAPLFKEGAGMVEEKFQAYAGAVSDARKSAEEALLTKLMADLARKDQKWWKEQRAVMRDEVEQLVNESKAYIALYGLQRGTLPDGSEYGEGMIPSKLSREAVVAKHGEDAIKSLPSGIYSDDGLPSDLVAQIFGYQNGEQLIAALSSLEPKDEVIEKETDKRMLETFGDLLQDGRLHDEAVEAIHTQDRAKVLRMELDHLVSDDFATFKGLAKKVSRRLPTNEAVREWASKIIGSAKVKDLRPHVHLRAEGRFAKEAVNALFRGDVDAAILAKENELRSHELYRASVAAKNILISAEKRFRKLFKSDEDLAKTRNMDFVGMARAIVAQIGIGRSQKDVAAYLEIIKRINPALHESTLALTEGLSAGVSDYRELSFDKFVDVNTAVAALWDLAKRDKQITIDGKIIDRDAALAELSVQAAQIVDVKGLEEYTRSMSDLDKLKMDAMGFLAQLKRTESWVKVMDMDRADGPFRKYIWNSVSEAASSYRIAQRNYLQKFLDIVKGIESTLDQKEIKAAEIGHIFKNKAELIGAMLHTGNESNFSKLLRGGARGKSWGHLDLEEQLDSTRWDSFVKRMQTEGILTKSDYDFLQSTWDLLEELKDPAQKAHKELYGYYFGEITARPITTPWGEYRGGYVPAVIDSYQTSDQAIKQEKESIEETGNSFMFPSPARGFTKKRVEAYAAPLSLDIRLIPSHIDKVLKFVHIGPAVRDVSKLVFAREFRSMMDQIDQSIAGKMLVPWLQRSIRQASETRTDNRLSDQVWRNLRRNTGLTMMVGHFVNTLQQFTGISISATKVRPSLLKKAMWRYVHNPKAMMETISASSKFMATRMEASVIEIKSSIDELILNPTKFEQAKIFAQRNGYILQAMTQGVVDSITWTAAYEQALEGGQDEKGRVRFADSVVRQTQGSFNPEDISDFETGTPFSRIFKMFYSYFNMQANLLGSEFSVVVRELGLKKGAGRLFYIYIMGFMIPAVISKAIMVASRGKTDEDDDGEYLDEVIDVFFGGQFDTALAMIPGGNIVKAGVNRWNKKWYDDRISVSPVVSTLESAAGTASGYTIYKAISGEMAASKAIRGISDILGLLGLPITPITRAVGYLTDVAQGEAQPSGAIDFMRGVVTGKK